jgi:DNA-binding CsgD family transcriptional regulator
MKTISLDTPLSPSLAGGALCDVVETVGGPCFVPALMDFCREAVGASDCSFFVHGAGEPIRVGTARLPGLQAHSVGDCYLRDGYYRIDPAARLADRADGRLLLNCMSRDELPDHQWVHDYEAIDLAERMSLLVAFEGGWGMLNAYRPARCSVPLDDAIDALGQQGPLIASAMRRHIRLAAPALGLPEPAPPQDDPFSVLSGRELQVVDAILAGFSAKESARQLGLSPTSIATYRQRAFDKLGIHRQLQLFQLRRPH